MDEGRIREVLHHLCSPWNFVNCRGELRERGAAKASAHHGDPPLATREILGGLNHRRDTSCGAVDDEEKHARGCLDAREVVKGHRAR